MSTASEKANLARIRDNQRRSRARRKEYLQELEARLRQCELQGIEASSEIQVAARQVAEENKKLRSLLSQHGVPDDSIEHHLLTSPSDTSINAYGSSSSQAVQVLEQLLQTRKTCCIDGSAPGHVPAERDSSSSTGTSTTQSPWDPIFTSNPSQGRRTTNTNPIKNIHQFVTPAASSASRKSSIISQTSGHGMHQQQQAPLAPIQIPRNPSRHSIPPSNRNQNQSQNQGMYDFVDSQLRLAHNHNQNHLQQQQNHNQAQRNVYIPPTTTSSNNNSNCAYATDMITSMAGGGDPSLVRADLGCYPGVEQCEVDSQIVFSVMDRYSGAAL